MTHSSGQLKIISSYSLPVAPHSFVAPFPYEHKNFSLSPLIIVTALVSMSTYST